MEKEIDLFKAVSNGSEPGAESNNEPDGISVLSFAEGGLIKALRKPDGYIYYQDGTRIGKDDYPIDKNA